MSLRSPQRRPERDARPLAQWRSEQPAVHLSADSDDPDPFWRWDFPGIIACIVIVVATIWAIGSIPK